MKPIILFRNDLDSEKEFISCKKYFNVVESRDKIPDNALVIGRYSCVPFYKELETLVETKKSKLLVPYSHHKYIASGEYLSDIVDFTPKTFTEANTLPEGSFIVKGETNSRKHEWKEKMFAPNKKRALEISKILKEDPLFNNQEIIFREFIPLENLGYQSSGLPMANEWRIFFYKKEILSYGFYWSESNQIPKDIDKEGLMFANKVASIISKKINFYVMDIAKTQNGEWIVIELNDAQQSGLSLNNPDILYSKLSSILI